jgi:large subunit ribosomal protein L17
MLRTMVSQLIEHERIETTVQKAKELRRVADKMVTWGKLVRITQSANRCHGWPSGVVQRRSAARLTPTALTRPPPFLPLQGTLAARREAAAVVRGDGVLRKLFGDLAERYKERDGGYTRILRTRQRPNDAAQMAFIEYIDRPGELRPPRPPRASLLPPAAQPLQQGGE